MYTYKRKEQKNSREARRNEMTNFTDGTKTVSIWMENVNGVEWSADFYDVGGLEYDEEAEAYKVESIEYLIPKLFLVILHEKILDLFELPRI